MSENRPIFKTMNTTNTKIMNNIEISVISEKYYYTNPTKIINIDLTCKIEYIENYDKLNELFLEIEYRLYIYSALTDHTTVSINNYDIYRKYKDYFINKNNFKLIDYLPNNILYKNEFVISFKKINYINVNYVIPPKYINIIINNSLEKSKNEMKLSNKMNLAL